MCYPKYYTDDLRVACDILNITRMVLKDPCDVLNIALMIAISCDILNYFLRYK
jgi:hypothetical protein